MKGHLIAKTYTRKSHFFKPLVKCVTKTIHLHDTCISTEDYNVALGLYERIWQLVAEAGFCVLRMWRY